MPASAVRWPLSPLLFMVLLLSLQMVLHDCDEWSDLPLGLHNRYSAMKSGCDMVGQREEIPLWRKRVRPNTPTEPATSSTQILNPQECNHAGIPESRPSSRTLGCTMDAWPEGELG